ncbi:hypothetical protein L873DRAFT_1673114 [Choiromyces venosus 120613-1]|uniref:Uncharacterized protein n=1 Tax=Choiromyces venosus 120613-1 TaxID=1336337 RepID=A0A3N4JW35_9PEZI|nr:hypothetical protein L873DRAFT_1673114 [Choiromyces venosus 120613-1]
MLSLAALPRGLILLLLGLTAPQRTRAFPSKINPDLLLDSDKSYKTYREKYKCLEEECYVYYGVDALYEGSCTVILHSPNAWSASIGLSGSDRDLKHPLTLPGTLYIGPTHSYGLRMFDPNDLFLALDATAKGSGDLGFSSINYMTSVFPALLLNGIRGKEGRVLWDVKAEAIMDDMESDTTSVHVGGELRYSVPTPPLDEFANSLKLYWPASWSSNLVKTGKTGRAANTRGVEKYLYSRPPVGRVPTVQPYEMRFDGIVEQRTAKVNFTVTDYCSRSVCEDWDDRYHFNYTVMFVGVNPAGGVGKVPMPVMEIHKDKLLFTDGRTGKLEEPQEVEDEDCGSVCRFFRWLGSISGLYIGVVLYGVLCMGLVLFFIRMMFFR